MFGWFSGAQPRFDPALTSRFVTLSKDNCRAYHTNEEDLGGVLYLNPAPVPRDDGSIYFEVKVEVVRNDEEDGLTLGVTTHLPDSSAEDAGCADDVQFSWSCGFDGRAHIHGNSDLLPIPWNPKFLHRGDLVGFYVSADGGACVLVNKKQVCLVPGQLPAPGDGTLHGVVDLLGNCQGCLLMENAEPPEEMKDFSLEKARHEVVDEMYTAVGEHNADKVKYYMELAQHLGVDEKEIQRVGKAMGDWAPTVAASRGRGPAAVATPPAASSAASPAAEAAPSPSPSKRQSQLGVPGETTQRRGSAQPGQKRASTSSRRPSQNKSPAEPPKSAVAQSKDMLKQKMSEAISVLDTDKNGVINTSDVAHLKTLIKEAVDSGVESSEVKKAEKKIAESELMSAIQSNTASLIAAALKKAKEVIDSSPVIDEAEKKLKELQKIVAEYTGQLQAAMKKAREANPPTVDTLDELQKATQKAKDVGLDISEAEALHAELVKKLEAVKKAAEMDLQLAVPQKNVAQIRACLATCKKFKSDEAINNALDALAPMIRADIDKAAIVEDKEERMKMLPPMQELLDILRDFAHPQLKKLHNDIVDLKGALRVFCRIRPLNKRELAMNDTIAVEGDGQFNVTITKGDPNAAKKKPEDVLNFSFDSIFLASNSQADVFEECKSLIQSSFDGYNVTIFTYGQTGAGKTWTLYGIPEQPGVSPRTCDEVFDVMLRDSEKFDFEVAASMIELYNSQVRDLLSREKTPPKIDIRNEKNPDGSTSVKLDCTRVPVKSADDLTKAVERGFGQRKVSSTSMNADSSRSHLMFTVYIKVKEKNGPKERNGKITIVDLAGSERLAKSQVTGDAQKEAIEINKSLTALGDVMGAITSKAKIVPYRNHKLTQLMQDSLGGTAKTLMFVNISPASNNADETANALKYAARARSIENDSGGKGGTLTPPKSGSRAASRSPSSGPKLKAPAGAKPQVTSSPRGRKV